MSESVVNLSKYIVCMIFGLIIGLSINMAIVLDQEDIIGEGIPEVENYKYLMAYKSQKKDIDWSVKMENNFREAFNKSTPLELNYIECFTDICVFAYREKTYLNSNSEWKKVEKSLPETKLRTDTMITLDGDSDMRKAQIFQFSRT